ncbi:MAG TPA: protein-glutamate O-methyltransferase CheR [Polyangiaceae bacterium]|jgi:chemotaxis protein methyltransferase CheR|nr:protein-glutamate O-methyltransferase CheR [Polyangiaceae bacterium]
MLHAEDDAFVRELLSRHAGLAFDSQQAHLLDSRLTSLARQQGLSGAEALVQALRSHPCGSLLENVVEALTTHETSFFRDRLPFVALADALIPELLENRPPGRGLSIWSAGCSTGQEAYSLALLLRELFPQLDYRQVRIHGTDVSPVTIRRARQGRFSAAEVKRGINDKFREKYFRREGSEFVVDASVRQMVTWSTGNLVDDWPVRGPFDVVLMRNVLIYFLPEARTKILERLATQLARDGLLLLGASETTFGLCDAFEPHTTPCGATVYRKAQHRAASDTLRSHQ